MADNIVGGLFGVDPSMLQRQQQATTDAQAYRYANMSPMEQAKYAQFAGGATLARGVGGLLGMEDPELAKASKIKQIVSQIDITNPEGLRQLASAIKDFAPQEAMMAVAEADKREQTGLGLQKTKADISKAELSAANEEKLRAELAALPANASEAQVIEVVRKYGSPDKILAILTASQDRAAARAAKGAGGGEGGLGKLTTAQKAVDTKFGKEYTDYFAGGGINSLEKNVEELGRAIQIIEQSKEGDTSGKLIGLADKSGTLTYVSPTAADVKDLIGGVAQSNLRQILGGQFAAKEGEQLLQRQYDTAQTKDNNLKRLRALYQQASDTVQDKKAAAQYYEEFGTLKGFKGTRASDKKGDNPPAANKNQDALDWIKANPTDPRVPAIKKKLGIS